MSNTKTISKTQKTVKIAPDLRKQNLFEVICSYGVTILSLILFGYIAIASVFYTSTINPDNFAGEEILYKRDELFMNLFLLGGFFTIILGLRKYVDIFRKVKFSFLVCGLAFYTLTLGMIWIYIAQSMPAADSGTVYDTAVSIINGDWTPFVTSNNDFYGNYSYYQLYPFQLGFVFISEIVYRIFGCDTSMPMQIFNVIALAAMYVGLMLIGKRIFKSMVVSFIMAFMLAGCTQAIFFTTFVYGNIIGFSASIWAAYFIIKFMQSAVTKNKIIFIAGASLLLAFAVLAKYNNMIWLAAIAIGLVVYVISSKKWIEAVSILAVIIIPVVSFNLVISSYESRSGVELGDGVSQLLYLDAGINESGMAPGWYNDMSKSMYVNSGCNGEIADEMAKADIDKRLEDFKDTGYAFDFFNKKVLSQWNEPSYESLWVSQVKGHYNGEVEPESLLDSIYNGKWNAFFEDYFDYFQMISFILFGAAMIGLIRKKCGAETIMMLTALLGGYFYHLLFEGKSQYILTYFILIVFFASYGLYYIYKPRSFNKEKSKKTFVGFITHAINTIESKTRKHN